MRVLFFLLLAGCYRSHELADAAPPPRPDASIPTFDAGAAPCAFARIGSIDVGSDGDFVTPRLVDLGGEIGVVYVGVGLGSPTANLLSKFPPDLTRASSALTLASTSFTWAEPAPAGDGLALCWGDDRQGSVIARFDREGRLLTMPGRIPFGGHCQDLVHGAGDRYALLASGGTGEPLLVAHVTSSGPLTREPLRLEGTIEPHVMSIAAVPDGFVIGLVRWAVGDNGSFLVRFGSEAPSTPVRIGEPSDVAVRVAFDGSNLAVLRFSPPRSILTMHDPGTLAPRGASRTIESGMSPPRLVAIDGGWALVTVTTSELSLQWVRGGEVGELREPLDPGFSSSDVDVLGRGRDLYATAHVESGTRRIVRVLRYGCR